MKEYQQNVLKFLMYRVELKEHMAKLNTCSKNKQFLMYRVELKVRPAFCFENR